MGTHHKTSRSHLLGRRSFLVLRHVTGELSIKDNRLTAQFRNIDLAEILILRMLSTENLTFRTMKTLAFETIV